ncbi:hypothetical protein HY464_01765, partial [Candidatus Peregrinibacteria bacterium]|nr:hypothetical protein [Candidatus Peregrinibacteria bacterium]
PGIYASTDGGASFTVLGRDVYVESIMPLPQDFTHMYAAGMQGFYDISAKNVDGAWQERVKPGPPGAVVKTIAVDPVDGKHLLVGLGREPAETPEGYGVYESRDGGKMWKKTTLPNTASYSILFNPKNPRIVYAALLGDGVYKSTDGGEIFTKIKDDRLKYTYRMAMSAGDPNVLLAGSNLFFAQLSGEEQSAGTLGGLFKSTDGGTTWKDVIASIRDYGPDEQGNFNGSLYNFGHMPNFEQMLIDPRDHRHMLVGHHGESVYMTADDGKTWEKQRSGMIPGDMHNYAYCLGADASFKTVYACTCGRGLFSGVVNPSGSISWRPPPGFTPAASGPT